MTGFEEMVNGVEKLHKIGYINRYWVNTDDDTGVKYIHTKIGEWTTSDAKGDGYETVARLKKECQKRGLTYRDNTVYNGFYIYESDPLDVF